MPYLPDGLLEGLHYRLRAVTRDTDLQGKAWQKIDGCHCELCRHFVGSFGDLVVAQDRDRLVELAEQAAFVIQSTALANMSQL